MPKTTVTMDDVTYIAWGKRIRKLHSPVRHRLRQICRHCRQVWGEHGCAKYLWATDFLSRFSLIVLPDRPDRPQRRHSPGYIAKLKQATREIQRRVRETGLGRPYPQLV